MGEVITVRNFKFLIWDADEFTHRYLEQNCEKFPHANVENILKKLKMKGGKDKLNTLAEEGTELVSAKDFHEWIKSVGASVNEHELHTL